MGFAILIVYIPLFLLFGILALLIGVKINDDKLTKTKWYYHYLFISIIASTIVILCITFFVKYHRNTDFGAFFTQIAITLISPIVCGLSIIFTSFVFKESLRSKIKIIGSGVVYSVFAIPWFGLFFGVYGNHVANSVVNYRDYTKLCENSKVEIYEKVSPAKSIFFYSDKIPIVPKGNHVQFYNFADSIVRDYKIDFVERPIIEGKDYLKGKKYIRRTRTSKDSQRNIVDYGYFITDEIMADYIIVSSLIELEKENKLGIGGNKIEVIRRSDNKIIAFTQYYWDDKNFKACPEEAHSSRFIDNFLQNSLNIEKVSNSY